MWAREEAFINNDMNIIVDRLRGVTSAPAQPIKIK